jgi:hypothetical protein
MILSSHIFLGGKYRKNPIKCVTTIFGLLVKILFNVSNLIIFKSGLIAMASLVRKSSAGKKNTWSV